MSVNTESGAPVGGGATNAGSGTWGSVSFALPQAMTDLGQSLNSMMELLTTALDVAVQALNLVKTYLASYIDPVEALIEAIISELREIIADFREIGVYITGDWNLLKSPFTDLLGGYQTFEQRMIARLTDRTDPTRPIAASTTSVFGAFFYTSGVPTEVPQIMSIIDQLKGFFNIQLGTAAGLPVPTMGAVRYGNDATDVLTYRSLTNAIRFSATPPNIARVSWTLEVPTTDALQSPFTPPPAGFLVAISTLRDGIQLMYDRPRVHTSKETDKNQDKKQQPREYGPVRDLNGKPIVLYGGIHQIKMDDALFGYDSASSDGVLKDGRARVYGKSPAFDRGQRGEDVAADADAIRLSGTTSDLSTTDGKQILQTTYIVNPTETGFQWFSDEYSFEASYTAMPFANRGDAKANENTAQTFYVRVATVGDKAILDENSPKDWRYDLSSGAVRPQAAATHIPFRIPMVESGLSPNAISAWSEPVEVVFPASATKLYFEALKVALAVLVLTRSDLPVIDDLKDLTTTDKEAAKRHEKLIEGVALKRTGLEPYKHLISLIYDDAGSIEGPFRGDWSDPTDFRLSLFRRINTVARFLYERSGPMPAAEQAIVESTTYLRSVKWSKLLRGLGTPQADAFALFLETEDPETKTKRDYTILESLNTGADDDFGRDLAELLTIEEEDPNAAADEEFGLAVSPWGMGQEADVVGYLFRAVHKDLKTSLIVTHRKPQFIEYPGFGGSFDPKGSLSALKQVQTEIPAEEAKEFVEGVHPGLRIFYERHVQIDGSIKLNQEEAIYLKELESLSKIVGSADRSPVLYFGQEAMQTFDPDASDAVQKSVEMGVIYCRTLLTEPDGGQLVAEAARVLGVASAAGMRPADDGAWYRRRLGDLFPALEGFLASIINWVESVAKAAESAVDALVKYIESVEERIADLQQFLRRINTLIQVSFSFGLTIPNINGLLLLSNGTDNLLADFVAAENKPDDPPNNYGAGIALVAPAAPDLLVDLIRVALEKPDASKPMIEALPTGPFGIEGVPEEELYPPSDPEPDVL